MQVEEKYMMRCLELAQSGRSSVAPNPMVGAVIVHKGQIIGEGFHRQYGCAHAEVNAIDAVQDESLLRDSTLYVNLEPCTHLGKTPPCTTFILQKQIPRVVIGCLDPYPKVAGKGITMLRDAGVEVVTEVMKQEAMELNRFFITAQTKRRPYIILKWAQSRDGYMDRIRNDASEKPVQLSTLATRRLLHKLRAEVSAIMIGTNTAWLDNPFLTVRQWTGNSPVRVFPDRTLRIPPSYHLLDGKVRTLVFVQGTENNCKGATWVSAQFKDQGSGIEECTDRVNTEYIEIDFSEPVIPRMLDALYERKLYSLLVEGGASLHQSFLNSGLWDELHVETVPIILENGVKAPVNQLKEIADHQRTIHFTRDYSKENEQSVLSVYYCKNM